MNILIADDEPSMLKILSAYFKKENMSVYTAKDGEEALDIFFSNNIDLAILDWMMPKLDGIEVCKEIKKFGSTKVLILTAKSQTEDEIKALDIGADEYIRKPFDPRILTLRAKKLLGYKDIQHIKDVKIDIKSNKVYKDDVEINITKKELELLICLSNNKGMILSREKLLDQVWGLDYEGDLRTIDTHIRRLRSKVGEGIIKTYRGLGYSVEEVDD